MIGVGVQSRPTPDADKVLAVILAIADIADPIAMQAVLDGARKAGDERRAAVAKEMDDLRAHRSAWADDVDALEKDRAYLAKEAQARDVVLGKRLSAVVDREHKVYAREEAIGVKAGQQRAELARIALDRGELDKSIAEFERRNAAIIEREALSVKLGAEVEAMRSDYEAKLSALRALAGG